MEDENSPVNKQKIPNEYVGVDKNDVTRSENHDPSYVSDVEHYEKRDTESPLQYKAFLLYAMMSSKKRSYRKCAEAIGKSDFWARKLAKKQDWTERINKEKSQADRRAFKAYCGRCVSEMTHGELRSVSRNMRFDPLAAFQKLNPELEAVTRPRLAVAEDESPVVHAVAKAMNDVETEVAKANDVDKRKQAIEKQTKVVQAVIGRGIEALKDGSMNISARDMKSFLELEQVVMGFTTDTEGKTHGTESVRVKFARDQGDDILVALRKDNADITTIVQALWDQREQQKQHDIEVEAERKRLMEELG